jgi:hypothetical protein
MYNPTRSTPTNRRFVRSNLVFPQPVQPSPLEFLDFQGASPPAGGRMRVAQHVSAGSVFDY